MAGFKNKRDTKNPEVRENRIRHFSETFFDVLFIDRRKNTFDNNLNFYLTCESLYDSYKVYLKDLNFWDYWKNNITESVEGFDFAKERFVYLLALFSIVKEIWIPFTEKKWLYNHKKKEVLENNYNVLIEDFKELYYEYDIDDNLNVTEKKDSPSLEQVEILKAENKIDEKLEDHIRCLLSIHTPEEKLHYHFNETWKEFEKMRDFFEKDNDKEYKINLLPKGDKDIYLQLRKTLAGPVNNGDIRHNNDSIIKIKQAKSFWAYGFLLIKEIYEEYKDI